MNDLRDVISDALESHTLVLIEYKDELRMIEPHHIGVLGGSEQVHAYQLNGREGWRNFKLEEIQRATTAAKEFNVRESYNFDGGNYTSVEEQLS